MRYGIEIVTLGPYADPRRVVELAVAAEEAGFELVAVWDHLAWAWGVPSADPLVTLAAVSQATERIRLLPYVTPLARHRPHVIAWQLACLDLCPTAAWCSVPAWVACPRSSSSSASPHLSAAARAMTDEALEVISRLWAGEKVEHAGEHYRIGGVTLAPLPVQRPRPAVWIGGESDAAIRRAARWDGWAGAGLEQDGRMTKSPSDVAAIVARLAGADAPLEGGFEIVLPAVRHGPGAADPRSYAEAGVTWWLESISPSYGDDAEMLARIRAGPPG